MSSLGYEVTIVDPKINCTDNCSSLLTGSEASLGVLMGYISKRYSGRSWELRKKSMELWPKWIEKLNKKIFSIKIKTPLIKLACSEKELSSIEKIAKDRKYLKIRKLSKVENEVFKFLFPKNNYGGVISENDGRLDVKQLQECLKENLKINNVQQISGIAKSINRQNACSSTRWEIDLENNHKIYSDNI